MSEGDFFGAAAKLSTAESIRRVEAQTSAELVVSVRPRSGEYGVLAYHFGLGLAAMTVSYLLLSPVVYSVTAICSDGLLAFVLGTVLAANVDTLRRLLSRASTLRRNVERAARAAFFDLGVSRTSARNGLLVYVSLFERRCVVLSDVGVERVTLEPAWQSVTEQLARATAQRDLPAFQRALESLGPLLERAHPRSADDVNELPDDVQ